MSLFLDFFNTQKSGKSFATFVSIILPCSKFSNIPISEKIQKEKRNKISSIFLFREEKYGEYLYYNRFNCTVYFNASDESKSLLTCALRHIRAKWINERSHPSKSSKKILLNVNARNIYNYVTILVFTFTEGNMNATNEIHPRDDFSHFYLASHRAVHLPAVKSLSPVKITRGNINRYRRHKGAHPILDIKASALAFIHHRVSHRGLSNW